MDMNELISSDCWFEFGVNFTNPLLVQHKTHLQTKSTLTHTANIQAGNTNENKQFWPKYKIINITSVLNI